MKLQDILSNIVLVVVIVIFILLAVFLYKSLFWKPGDDLFTTVRNLECSGQNCTIEFKYNVSSYWKARGTGSDVPVVGGEDWIICLNGSEVVEAGDLRVGMLVGTAYLHFIESMENGWVLTRGSNAFWTDPYKFPISSVICVVGGVLR